MLHLKTKVSKRKLKAKKKKNKKIHVPIVTKLQQMIDRNIDAILSIATV